MHTSRFKFIAPLICMLTMLSGCLDGGGSNSGPGLSSASQSIANNDTTLDVISASQSESSSSQQDADTPPVEVEDNPVASEAASEDFSDELAELRRIVAEAENATEVLDIPVRLNDDSDADRNEVDSLISLATEAVLIIQRLEAVDIDVAAERVAMESVRQTIEDLIAQTQVLDERLVVIKATAQEQVPELVIPLHQADIESLLSVLEEGILVSGQLYDLEAEVAFESDKALALQLVDRTLVLEKRFVQLTSELEIQIQQLIVPVSDEVAGAVTQKLAESMSVSDQLGNPLSSVERINSLNAQLANVIDLTARLQANLDETLQMTESKIVVLEVPVAQVDIDEISGLIHQSKALAEQLSNNDVLLMVVGYQNLLTSYQEQTAVYYQEVAIEEERQRLVGSLTVAIVDLESGVNGLSIPVEESDVAALRAIASNATAVANQLSDDVSKQAVQGYLQTINDLIDETNSLQEALDLVVSQTSQLVDEQVVPTPAAVTERFSELVGEGFMLADQLENTATRQQLVALQAQFNIGGAETEQLRAQLQELQSGISSDLAAAGVPVSDDVVANITTQITTLEVIATRFTEDSHEEIEQYKSSLSQLQAQTVVYYEQVAAKEEQDRLIALAASLSVAITDIESGVGGLSIPVVEGDVGVLRAIASDANAVANQLNDEISRQVIQVHIQTINDLIDETSSLQEALDLVLEQATLLIEDQVVPTPQSAIDSFTELADQGFALADQLQNGEKRQQLVALQAQFNIGGAETEQLRDQLQELRSDIASGLAAAGVPVGDSVVANITAQITTLEVIAARFTEESHEDDIEQYKSSLSQLQEQTVTYYKQVAAEEELQRLRTSLAAALAELELGVNALTLPVREDDSDVVALRSIADSAAITGEQVSDDTVAPVIAGYLQAINNLINKTNSSVVELELVMLQVSQALAFQVVPTPSEEVGEFAGLIDKGFTLADLLMDDATRAQLTMLQTQFNVGVVETEQLREQYITLQEALSADIALVSAPISDSVYADLEAKIAAIELIAVRFTGESYAEQVGQYKSLLAQAKQETETLSQHLTDLIVLLENEVAVIGVPVSEADLDSLTDMLEEASELAEAFGFTEIQEQVAVLNSNMDSLIADTNRLTASIELSWDVALEREDGVEMSTQDVAGYRISIYRGDAFVKDIDTESDVFEHYIDDLEPGIYRFTVSTLDFYNQYSAPSNFEVKEIRLAYQR